jgi:hypothetical protein
MWACMLVTAACVYATALAHPPPPPPRQGRTPPTLVLPVPGTALSAEVVEERVTKASDGTSKTELTTSKVFRDEAGRVREERDLDNPTSKIIVIMDRPDGFMALLVPSQRIGGRFPLPKKDFSGGYSIAFLGDPLIRVPGEKEVKSESLGKQTIDGIEYEGERTTTTSKGQPSLVGIEERWFARDLGLFALMKSAGPDEQSTAKLTKVDRRAPDPALFQIPADYVIQDLKDDPQPQ